jgi:predicted ATP-dependent serine protease
MLTRLKEAQKLGFKHAVVPRAGDVDAGSLKLAVSRVADVKGLAATLGL